MISLESNMVLFTDTDWAVLVGGEYQPDSIVECYKISDPSQVVGYYAQYIVSGEYPQ